MNGMMMYIDSKFTGTVNNRRKEKQSDSAGEKNHCWCVYI